MESQTQRTLLFGFIGSIVCCGLVGIYCLLVGDMGAFEGRVLVTTLAIGCASILGLASAIPWERRRWHPIGPGGLIAVSAALVLALPAIWIAQSSLPEDFYSAVAVAYVIAVALPHIGLLSLARLRRGYEWVRLGSVIAVILLAVLISGAILTESDDDAWFRIMGVLAILVICGTIAVPLLHRVSAIRVREAVRTVELALSLTCPRCAKTQEVPVGRSKCVDCGLKFSLEIEEEHCPTCGYPLYKLHSSVCPECGTPITGRETPDPGEPRE